ncbi:MAG: DUF4363 family protein [Eubacteriales bacterium]|nr:DUF4363 family protein [Eubacteriales bacterium]
MKSVIIASLILIVIIVTIFLVNFYTNSAIEELNRAFDLVDKAVGEENWEEAAACFDGFLALWDKKKTVFFITHHHNHVDVVEESIPLIKVFLETKDLPRYLSEAATLKSEFEHLRDADKIFTHNLF